MNKKFLVLSRDLNQLFGEGTISKSQVERWHTPSPLIASLQWTPFRIPLGETPDETQTDVFEEKP